MHPSSSISDASDYVLMGIYFVIIVWVGFYSSRKNKGTKDYFTAGEQVPWLMSGVSTWVSGFSAFMFVAAAGYIYENGLGAALEFTSAFWAYGVGYFLFARLWRRARLEAPLDFLTQRFSASTTYWYTVTAIPVQVAYIGQVLYILCIFVTAALGIDQTTYHLFGFSISAMRLSILTIGTVAIIYSVAGGLWAAVLSTSVQSVITLVMSLIICPAAFYYLGAHGHPGGGIITGIKRLFHEVPTSYLVPSTKPGEAGNPWFLFSYIITVMLGYNLQWNIVQRYNSVPSETDARKMSLLCAWLSLVGPLLWIFPVLCSKLIFPDMHVVWPNLANPNEGSFAAMASLVLPHGMLGLVIAAIVSASLGVCNDNFNWLAASTTRDVCVPLRRKFGLAPWPDRTEMRVAQISMLLIGVLSVGAGLLISHIGAFEFTLKYGSLTTTSFWMPQVLGLLYRKTPWWSGIASAVGGTLIACIVFFWDPFPAHIYAENTLSSVLGGTLVFFATVPWYRADDPRNAEANRLFERLRTPFAARPATGHGALPVYAVIGNISLLLGVIMLGCWFLPSKSAAPSLLNAVGAVMLFLIGAWLRRVARATRGVVAETDAGIDPVAEPANE